MKLWNRFLLQWKKFNNAYCMIDGNLQKRCPIQKHAIYVIFDGIVQRLSEDILCVILEMRC